ncbi:MAG: inorganic diphosphatase [Candidatus Saccharibacteria bacterium]|nr:inorganic diphosphatase [Candidatus Saccharibacteria bacterium]
MTDFDKTLTPGDVKNGQVNVVIEMPAGSIDKVEWHRQIAGFRLDRTNQTSFPVPVNYGFIPGTLNDDDDELDVLVISEKPIQTEVSLMAKIIGVMKFEDEGETDDKIITIQNDNASSGINSIADIPKTQIDRITHYFAHYKDYISPGCTKVLGWGDVDEAKKVINKSIWLWDEQINK